MRRFIGSLAVVLLLTIAICIAIILGMPLIPLERLSPQIEQRASSFLGRDVKIQGALRLAALPSPRLQVDNVSLANWTDSENPDLATIGKLDLIIDLAALLRQEIRIQRLIIKRPQLHLEQRGNRSNWQLDLASAVEPSTTPTPEFDGTVETSGFTLADFAVETMEIIDGQGFYVNDQGASETFHDLNLAIEMLGLSQPFDAEMSARWHDHEIAFSGQLMSMASILSGEVFTVNGNIELDDHRVSAEGSANLGHGKLSVAGLELTAEGQSLSDLLDIINVPTVIDPRVLAAYRLSGQFDYADDLLNAQALSVKIQDLEFEGDFLTSFKGGFFAQSRTPVLLKVGKLNQWLQALPNPPLASRPDLFGEMLFSGALAIAPQSIDVFEADLQVGGLEVSGAATLTLPSKPMDDFTFITHGPISASVTDLNAWLAVMNNPLIPNNPDLFGELRFNGELAATQNSFSLQEGSIQLGDLSLEGGMDALFDTQRFEYRSHGPLKLEIGNSNRWLDLLPDRPLPSAPDLFSKLAIAAGISGSSTELDLVDIQLSLGEIQGVGSVRLGLDGEAIEVQSQEGLRLSGPSFDQIAQAFDMRLPRVAPDAYGAFDIQSKLNYSAQNLTMTDLEFQMDQTDIAGSLRVDTAAQPVAFDATLTAGTIDTRPYINVEKQSPSGRETVAAANPQAPWGSVPIALNFLTAAQGKATIRMQQVVTGLVDLGATAAQLDWRNNALTVDFAGTQLYGGQARGQVGLTSQNTTSGLAANLFFNGVDAGRILADFLGVDKIQGVTALSLQLATEGEVLHDWMSVLNGRFDAQIDPLAFLGIDLLASFDNLKQGRFATATGPEERTRLQQVSLSGQIIDGVASINDLEADLQGINVLGKGLIDIGMQRLDYRLELLFNNQVPLPLIIRGPWLRPAIRIDSQRVMAFAVDNPQLFLAALPAEWNLQGLLPDNFSLANIEEQAARALAGERARIEALARAEAERLAQEAAARAQAEANRLAQEAAARAQAEADRRTQALADRAAEEARRQAEQLGNQLGGQAGQLLQNTVNNGIEQLGDSQIGEQLQQQATTAAQGALNNLLDNLLGN